MYKKLIYTSISVPFSYVTWNAYLWQRRRKTEKIEEIEKRRKQLEKEPINVTPKNNEGDYEFNLIPNDEFEEKYAYRPISVTGIYDHKNEIFVERVIDNEHGYWVMTPLYTHVSEKGDKQGVFVDRGWIDDKYRYSKLHYGDGDIKQKINTIKYLTYYFLTTKIFFCIADIRESIILFIWN